MNSNTETKCTCTDPAVACPSCLANRDRHGWPKNWQERMGSKAAVAVVTDSGSGYAIGYADENVAGYTPTTYTYGSFEAAQVAARLWNERAGLSPQRASEIVLSTMRVDR